MKELIKTVFRPYSNRNYTDKRTSFTYDIAGFLPVLIVGVVAAFFYDARIWWAVIGFVALMVFSYFTYDSAGDTLTWRLFWKRFYPENAFKRSKEHEAIKKYESNPSVANKKAMKKHLEQ